MDIAQHIWIKTANYWDVFFTMDRTIYFSFNKEGTLFPFPQFTIHKFHEVPLTLEDLAISEVSLYLLTCPVSFRHRF